MLDDAPATPPDPPPSRADRAPQVPLPTPLPTSVAQMRRVSPKLMVPKTLGTLIGAAVVLGGMGWAFTQWGDTMRTGWIIGFVAVGLFFAWLLVLIPFRVRNMAYLETADELILSTGKLWHTVTTIPYGRIQFVDVKSGPITRALGLKELEVNTASATSNSNLPGLPAAEADALRDRLAAKARERMSGL